MDLEQAISAVPVAPIGATPEAPAAEPAAPEVAAPTPESGAPAEKPADEKGSPVQKRIDQLTWKAHEAERRANAAILRQQELEQRLAQAENERLDALRRQTMPRFEQYGDPQAFDKAVEEHTKAYIAEQTKIAQEAQQRQQQAAAAAQLNAIVSSVAAEGQAKFPDYQEVMNAPGVPQLLTEAPALFVAVLEHPRRVDLSYFLAKNQPEAHRLVSIARTNPARALLELGEIGAKLPAATARAQSQAPAPPNTVGSGSGPVHKKPEDMTYKEFVEWRHRSLGQRGRRVT